MKAEVRVLSQQLRGDNCIVKCALENGDTGFDDKTGRHASV